MRTSDKTNTIVMTAMMMCLVLVTTYTFKIPTPFQGYVHLGDAMIFLSVLIVGKNTVQLPQLSVLPLQTCSAAMSLSHHGPL